MRLPGRGGSRPRQRGMSGAARAAATRSSSRIRHRCERQRGLLVAHAPAHDLSAGEVEHIAGQILDDLRAAIGGIVAACGRGLRARAERLAPGFGQKEARRRVGHRAEENGRGEPPDTVSGELPGAALRQLPADEAELSSGEQPAQRRESGFPCFLPPSGLSLPSPQDSTGGLIPPGTASSPVLCVPQGSGLRGPRFAVRSTVPGLA
jgi:hypothetical protein